MRAKYLLTTALALAPLVASAEPVITPGGKPGAAKAWTAGDGGATVLELAAGFTPESVAAAIGKGVPGAKAAVKDGKVVVTGVESKKLMAALEKLDVTADDVDAMVAAIQGGGSEEGSGSSIRASKATELTGVAAPAAEPVSVGATVLSVKHGKYPFVAVTLKLDAVPKALADAGVKAGGKLTVVPRVKLEGGRIAPTDEQSKANIGAWYARTGDKVQVSVEGKSPEGFWIASKFERPVR